MLTTYAVEYSPRFRKHSPPAHHVYHTDDPVAAEEFLQELLEQGMGIHAIKREGADLPQPEFDRFVRIAAARLAADHICASLNIRPEEEHFRFGFTD